MAVNLPIITEFNGQGINRAIAEFKRLETNSEKAAFVMKKAFLPATAALGGLAAAAGPAIKAASDLNETMSKSEVIFGNVAKEVQAFARTAARSLGQSETQALDAASTFAVFGKSAGLAGKELSKFAIDFTGLASDLASFNNTSPEDAIMAIGAALRGESEPIRRYGVLLSDAVLKQEALALGIYDGSGALTAQQKVLAAQAAIYKQTTDAQGDFLRTSEGLANQTRILSAEFDNAKAKIGQSLLPVLLEIMPHLVNMASWVGENTDLVVKLASGVGGLAAAITLANVGLKIYNVTAILTAGLNRLLASSFAGARLSVVGFTGVLSLSLLTLTELQSAMKDPWAWGEFKRLASNTAALINNIFMAVANQIRNAVTVVANGMIQIANVGIDALNALVPGNPIPKFNEYRYAAWNEGFRDFSWTPTSSNASGLTPNFMGENRGAMPSGVGLAPALPNIIPPTGTGSAAGAAARGAAAVSGGPVIYGPSPASSFTAESFMAAHESMFGPVTVNVNGGLATGAEIGESVVNALRQYNQVQGPIPVAVA